MFYGKKISTALFALVLLGFSQLMLAADWSPHVGTWAINQENNGKPGRGFQIDFQNDILVLYFYGYEDTGESTYWLAAGKFSKGSNQLTADLGAYQGGMAFGDPIKNATYLGARGQVTIRFNSAVSGQICLPNEACKAISAFNFGYEANSSELIGTWLVNTLNSSTGGTVVYSVRFSRVIETDDPDTSDGAFGAALATFDDGSTGVADVVCSRLIDPSPFQYYCGFVTSGKVVLFFRMTPSRNGFNGLYYKSQSAETEGAVIAYRLSGESGRLIFAD